MLKVQDQVCPEILVISMGCSWMTEMQQVPGGTRSKRPVWKTVCDNLIGMLREILSHCSPLIEKQIAKGADPKDFAVAVL